jgi:four helix bundle protein
MEISNVKIKVFTDFIKWQKDHKVVLTIYQLTTKFPKTGTSALIEQIKRCVVSISSTLVEGFFEKKAGKTQFYIWY